LGKRKNERVSPKLRRYSFKNRNNDDGPGTELLVWKSKKNKTGKKGISKSYLTNTFLMRNIRAAISTRGTTTRNPKSLAAVIEGLHLDLNDTDQTIMVTRNGSFVTGNIDPFRQAALLLESKRKNKMALKGIMARCMFKAGRINSDIFRLNQFGATDLLKLSINSMGIKRVNEKWNYAKFESHVDDENSSVTLGDD
jgi:hypothetical protein